MGIIECVGAMGTDMDSTPNENGLTIQEAKSLGVGCTRTIWNRMNDGTFQWWIGADGKRYIHRRSLPASIQEKLLERELRASASARPTSGSQMQLFERIPIDDELEALEFSEPTKAIISKRLYVVQQLENCNWRSLGFRSKRAFGNAISAQAGLSYRHLQRLAKSYRETRSLKSLVPEVRGPKPHKFPSLDVDAQIHLDACFLKGLNARQAHSSLMRYLEIKQKSAGIGASYAYSFPSYHLVARFYRSRNALARAARNGAAALKQACGYIDRSYRDLRSLDVVETDEWKCDFLVYNPRRLKIVRRWWLLTFYDRRSMYPLVGKLVAGSDHDRRHGIRESDEIEILVTLLKEYGAPKEIYSDHGRFRGKTFGGRERFNGILDRLGIRKGEPREKNPRGSRLERFHRYLADCCRTVPGWIGANDKQREMTPGDAQRELHMRWVKGDPEVPRTPLLSITEAMAEIEKWMEAWRDHKSEGTDMDGLSPRAVFIHETPEGGFRRLTDTEIDFATAEHVHDRLIQSGGIIELRDGKRYSHPALLLLAGQRREIVRKRDDHSRISVLPAHKGEEIVIAQRRERVGLNDPKNLASAMELQNRIRKIAGRAVVPSEMKADPLLLANAAAPLPDARRLGLVASIAVDNDGKGGVEPRDFADLVVNDDGKSGVEPLDFADLED